MTSAKHLIVGFCFLYSSLALACVLRAKEPANEQASEAPWQSDLMAFKKHIIEVAETARTPSQEEFSARYRSGPEGELGLIEDLGLLDFKPGKDTVQFKINEAFKGNSINWEIELGDDADEDTLFLSQFFLSPKWDLEIEPKRAKEGRPQLGPILCDLKSTIIPPTELRAGDRIRVEGRIGDASINREEMGPWHGPTVFYYGTRIVKDGKPVGSPIVFWIGLENVKITRIAPTSEELKSLVLSGKPGLDRESWKILEVNGEAEFDNDLIRNAIDGDAATAWDTPVEDGKPGQ